MDAVAAEQPREGARRIRRWRARTWPEVVRVVGVLRRARGCQPPLVHLERGDRRDVARADVAGRPARRGGWPGEQRGVVGQPHRPGAAGGQPVGGRGGQGGERGGLRVVAARRRARGERRVAPADQGEQARPGAGDHPGGEPCRGAERAQRRHRGEQFGVGRRDECRPGVLREQHGAGFQVGDDRTHVPPQRMRREQRREQGGQPRTVRQRVPRAGRGQHRGRGFEPGPGHPRHLPQGQPRGQHVGDCHARAQGKDIKHRERDQRGDTGAVRHHLSSHEMLGLAYGRSHARLAARDRAAVARPASGDGVTSLSSRGRREWSSR